MTTKRFHLGDVLSVTTGILMSRDGVGGIYKILSWMTGETLFTHQLPRACKACAPALLKQFPQLAGASCAGVNADNHAARLAELVARYGEWFDVAPFGPGEYESKDPLTELVEMAGPEKVIVVEGP